MPRSRLLLPIAAFASVATAGFGMAAAPAAAQAPATYFQAQLAAPASDARVIAGGVVWRCTGTTCTAPESGKRPLRVCRELSREVGEISSFAINGEALEADRLARCNG